MRTPTYYFSAAGNDANDGRTIYTPKQTITAFNALPLTAGDYVVFRGGDTFTGAMVIPGSGSAIINILIGSYGTGTATISPTNVNTDAIKATNRSYVTIDGIDVVGPGGVGTGTGIYFSSTSGIQQQCNVKNVNVSLCGSAGIVLGGDATGANGFANCTIESFNSFSNNGEGVSVYGWDAGVRVNSNITIQNGTVHDNGDDGAFIGSSSGGLIDNCVAYANGALSTSGPVGFWTYDSDNVVISRCISVSNTSSNASDGDGFDIDGNCTDCVIEYCYASDNKGAGFLLYNYAGAGAWDNNTVRYCIGEDNGNGNAFYGEIHIGYDVGAGAMTNAIVYNCTFFNSRSGVSVVQVLNADISGRVANCSFYSYGPSKLATVAGSPASMYFTGNNWFGTSFSITWNSVVYTTYAAWQAATNQEKISGSNVGYNVDPMLYYPGNGGAATTPYSTSSPIAYKLQPDSPLLTAGLDLNAQFGINPGTTDYYGGAIGLGNYPVGAGGSNSTATVTVESETAAAVAAFTTPPTNALKSAINEVIRGGKADGFWSLLDAWQEYSAADSQSARVDWATPSRVATLSNSPTFTAFQGFTTDGSSSFIDTQVNPTLATNASQNSVCFGVVSRTAGSIAASGSGWFDGTDGITINPRNGSSMSYRVAQATASNTATPAVSSGVGVFAANRSASNATAASQNDIEFDSGSVASTAFNNATLRMGSITNASFQARQWAGMMLSSSMTSTQRKAAFYRRQTYLAAVNNPL